MNKYQQLSASGRVKPRLIGKFVFLVLVLLLAMSLLAACSKAPGEPTPIPLPTNTLPPPDVRVTRSPEAEAAARQYLDAWKIEDYPTMYGMLASASQAAILSEQFIQRYQAVANESAMSGVDYEITTRTISPQESEFGYRVTLHSAVAGDISRETAMKLVNENGQWRVVWDDAIIIPDLAGGAYFSLDRSTPTRAAIYDRNGNPLASQQEAVAIGIWPGYIDLADKSTVGLLSLLSNLSNYRTDTISRLIERYQEVDPGGYLPISEIPADQDPRRVQALSTYGAAVVSNYSSRLYHGSGIGPHITGYVSPIQQEEISEYRAQGYGPGERVGRKGLELWGEQILAGKHGGAVYIFAPDGRLVTDLGSTPAEAGQDIYTTIDRDLQYQAQKAMSVFSGAAVVLERDTGRVLALVSTPGFDPNAYEIENFNWNTLINGIVTDPDLPQFNRATQGQYPLGSVFKIITLSTALESGRYTPDMTYDCQYTFEELPGFTRYDWTWDHFQDDGHTRPSGLLTVPEALMRSCNPFFWHVGLDMYRIGLTTAISDMATGFGLGNTTGIEVLDEEPGKIPSPASDVDAINLAIGQGEMLVTPLQVARFAAALGNGGTLYRPQLIERIQPPNGEATFTFQPEAQGTLPIKPETLQTLQEAMLGVVRNTIPEGTAFRVFNGLDIKVAGKTGTATAPAGDPHAWFAGYTFENNPDKPDIAVVVIAENAGEGSEVAAPIFRRIVEIYFYGKPLKTYRWETTFDVTRSPTSPFDETPPATQQPGFVNP